MHFDRVTFRLVFAQGLDVLTFLAFYVLVGASTHEERNPILLVLMALGGIQLVGIAKMAIAIRVARNYQRPVKLRRGQAAVDPWFLPVRTVLISAGAASGIVGAGFNLASIVNATTGFALTIG